MIQLEGRFERRTPGVGQPKTVLDSLEWWKGVGRTNRVGVEQRANAVRLLLRERFAGVNPDVFASGPANRDNNMKRYDCTHEKCIDESTSGVSRDFGGDFAPDRRSCLSLQRESDDVTGIVRESGGPIQEDNSPYSD